MNIFANPDIIVVQINFYFYKNLFNYLSIYHTIILMQTILQSDIQKDIKFIYHISDIHIRKTERHEEYIQVFNNLYSKIKNNNNNSLIVITGDILHEGISPENIILTKNFFINLTNICPVIVIIGNHDQTSRSNHETVDYVSPIIMKLDTKYKIHLLIKDGLYIYNNIVFGFTSMISNHVISCNIQDKIKIGLWHGIIHGSTNCDDFILSNQSSTNFTFGNSRMFNTSDFKDYDYVMLGDVHKFQYLNKNKTIAYASSLIQQNFGESLNYHGMIKWNLKKKTNKFIEIENDFGLLNIYIENSQEYILPNILPKNVNVKITYKNTNKETIELLQNTIALKTNIIKIYIEKLDNDMIITLGSKKQKLHNIKNDNMAINILNTHIDELYTNCKTTDFEDIKKTDLIATIAKIMKEIGYDYTSIEKNIVLKSLEFDNFNIYGEKNFIDYTKLQNIVGIFGKNHIGKSSLAIYVLLFAIYGYTETNSSISKGDYVNITKNNIRTKITLELNNDEYCIERSGYFKKKLKREDFHAQVILYKNKIDISGKNIKAIETTIKKLFGTPDDLLDICIMRQSDCSCFINMKDTEKKEYICNILKLNIYNNIAQKAQYELRSLYQLLGIKNKIIFIDTKDKSILLHKELTNIKKNSLKIKKILLKKNNILQKCTRKKIEYEIKLQDYDIKDNTIVDLNANITDICVNITQKEKAINKLSDNNNKYNNIDNVKQQYDIAKVNKIKELEHNIHKLLEEHRIVETIINYKQEKKLITEKKQLLIQQNTLNTYLLEINVNIETYKQNINDEILPNILQINKKYKKYCMVAEEKENLDKYIIVKQKELKEYQKKEEKLKNYEYNKDCKQCIENQMTKDKLYIIETIDYINKDLEEKQIQIENINIKYNLLNKYEKIYQEQQIKIENNEKYTQLYNKVFNEKTKIEKDLIIINLNMVDIQKQLDTIQEFKNIIIRNKEIKNEIANITEQIEEIKLETCDIYEEYLNNKNMINKLVKELEILQEIKKKIEKYFVYFDNKNNLEQILIKYDSIMLKIKNFNIIVLENEKKIGMLENEIKNIELAKEEREKILQEKKIYEKICSIINNGFIDDILKNKILPEFENSINDILAYFVDYKIKIIYEKSEKSMKSMIKMFKCLNNDKLVSILTLSGYESMILNICCRIAINKINKNIKTNFFILDEIFVYCDDTNISKISNLFEYLKTKFNFVLIITHDNQLKKYVDTELIIQKDCDSYICVK